MPLQEEHERTQNQYVQTSGIALNESFKRKQGYHGLHEEDVLRLEVPVRYPLSVQEIHT